MVVRFKILEEVELSDPKEKKERMLSLIEPEQLEELRISSRL